MPSSTSVEAFVRDAGTTERMRERVAEVRRVQTSLGMAPRDDSLLTIAFAREDEEVALRYVEAHDVAIDLYVVDTIHHETLYPELIEEAMRRVASDARAMYGLRRWDEVWKVVRWYVPTMVKLYCAAYCQSSLAV